MYANQGYMQIFFQEEGGGGEENLSVFMVVCRGPRSLIFRESRPCPTCTTEFFFTWKEGKVTVKESESVTDTPPYFEKNTQTNPMSVRGEPAATRLVVCNFTLPSP